MQAFKRFSLGSLNTALKDTFQRFLFPSLTLIATAALAIASRFGMFVFTGELTFCLYVLFTATVAVKIWCDFLGKSKYVFPISLAVFFLTAADLVFVTIHPGEFGQYEHISRAAIAVCTTVAAFILPPGEGQKKSIIFADRQIQNAIICMILFYILVLFTFSIYATLSELFGLRNEKVGFTIGCLLSLVPGFYLLSSVPRAHKFSPVPRPWIAAVQLYVVLPLATIYLAVLYAYLLKALFTFTMPNGITTILVSIMLCIGLITVYGIQPYTAEQGPKSRVAALSLKLFPWLMLPLCVMMSIAIGMRINEYGITTFRLYIVAFNVWTYAMLAYLMFCKKGSMNRIFISFALTFLLVTVIPGFNLTTAGERAESIKTAQSQEPSYIHFDFDDNSTEALQVPEGFTHFYSESYYFDIVRKPPFITKDGTKIHMPADSLTRLIDNTATLPITFEAEEDGQPARFVCDRISFRTDSVHNNIEISYIKGYVFTK